MIEKNALPHDFRVKTTQTLDDKNLISQGPLAKASISAHCVMILLH